MKHFIVKCILLIFTVSSVFLLANYIFVHGGMYQQLQSNDWTDEYAAMPDAVDIAVFGASHGHYTFRYFPDDAKVFNYSLSYQTPQYDLMLMREYKDHIKPGALVILTVSYPSPFWSETDETFENKQGRYYRILSPDNIIDVDLSRYYLQRYLPVLGEGIISVSAAIKETLFGGDVFKQTQDDKAMAVEEIPSEIQRVKRVYWNKNISILFPDTNPVMMDAYREMLQMCKDNGWQAVLVTPPCLSVFYEAFPDEFYPVFYDAIEKISNKFDVPYYDYSRDPLYMDRYDFFLNVDHLNLNGASVFDELFFDRLNADGVY